MRNHHISSGDLLHHCDHYLTLPYIPPVSTVAKLSSGLYYHNGRGSFRRPEVNQNVTPVMWHFSVLQSM